MIDKPFVLYTLAKSRTTQPILNGRKIESAWKNVSTFINTCTTTQSLEPDNIALVGYSAHKDDGYAELAEQIIDNTKLIFGQGKTSPLSYSYPSGIPDKQTKTEWNLDKDLFMKAVDYLIQGQPWPKFTFGPLELIVAYNFKLLDPSTNNLLLDQSTDSSLMIWLSRNSVCSPTLYFPFSQANIEFHNYLNKIETFLPFKLEAKYLRLGKPNKNGSGYIFSKIPEK